MADEIALPNQAAEELMQLARRMLNGDTATPEIKQMLQQLAEQLPAMHPEKMLTVRRSPDER